MTLLQKETGRHSRDFLPRSMRARGIDVDATSGALSASLTEMSVQAGHKSA